MSNEYTVEHYEEQAKFLSDCLVEGKLPDGKDTPLQSLRWKHQDKLAAMLRQAAQMMREQSPASINEALNVIEHWGIRGNTLSGDDVDRFRALVDKIAPRESVKVTDEDIDRALEAYSDADAECEIAYRPNMRAALESFATRPAVVPDGWKLVPVDATSAMQAAGGHANSEWLNDNAPLGENRYGGPVMRSVWEAMLAAAPEVTK
jgi:hypothetical protein